MTMITETWADSRDPLGMSADTLRQLLGQSDWATTATKIFTAAAVADVAAAGVLTKLEKTPTFSGATRALDTPFQVSADWPSLVLYTITLDVTAGLLSPDSIGVILYSDDVNPPATVHGRSFLYGNQLLGLAAVGLRVIQRQLLVAYVQPGHYVQLVTTGTGVVVLNNQLELVFSG